MPVGIPAVASGTSSGRGNSPRSLPGGSRFLPWALGAPSAPHLPALSLAAPRSRRPRTAAPPFLVSREHRARGRWEGDWSPDPEAWAGPAVEWGPCCEVAVTCRCGWCRKRRPCLLQELLALLAEVCEVRSLRPHLRRALARVCTCSHACAPGDAPLAAPLGAECTCSEDESAMGPQAWAECPGHSSPCGASWLTARPAPAVWPH